MFGRFYPMDVRSRKCPYSWPNYRILPHKQRWNAIFFFILKKCYLEEEERRNQTWKFWINRNVTHYISIRRRAEEFYKSEKRMRGCRHEVRQLRIKQYRTGPANSNAWQRHNRLIRPIDQQATKLTREQAIMRSYNYEILNHFQFSSWSAANHQRDG